MNGLSNVSAVVLASGAGTRLGDVTKSVPKPMLYFNGKPYLFYLLNWLIAAGVQDIVVTTCVHSDIIESFISSEPLFKDIVSTVREDSLVSTVQSSRVGLSAVKNPLSFLLTADSLWDIDLKNVYKSHIKNQAKVTAAITRRENFPNYGMVKFIANEQIVQFLPNFGNQVQEHMGLKSASTIGLYLLNVKAILENIDKDDTSIEREPMSRLIPHAYGFLYDDFFLDYGTPENYVWLKKHPEAINKTLGKQLGSLDRVSSEKATR